MKVSLAGRTALKEFVHFLFKQEDTKLKSLNIIFCTDSYLLQINKDYLSHNYYTDIITFFYSKSNEPVQAEMYISIERVKDNAILLESTNTSELHRVIFHGCLHLCGYGDKTSQQIKKMREREDYYLRLYFSKRKKT